MRAYANPRTVSVPASGNLTDDVLRHVEKNPELTLFRRRDEIGWRDVTAAEFREDVAAAAKGLFAWGIRPGDRVGLLSRTRYEWTVLDYAIWTAGAVSVPVYDTASTEQAGWVLSDAGAVACLVETTATAERMSAAGVASVARIGAIDDGLVAELSERGRSVSDTELEARRSTTGPDDLATILYTSGTTGRPKGCELTHGNLLAELDAVTGDLPELFLDGASTLLFLPLPHVFARLVQLACVRSGGVLGHTATVVGLLDAVAEFRPTFLLAVPRVFEQFAHTLSQRAAIDGRARAFESASEAAIAYSRALDAGRPGPVLRLRHARHERATYRGLRDQFGGQVRVAVTGGAPLGERLAHFYRGIGIPVLEGYGLTETAAAVTVNLPGDSKIGTVGRPVAGVEVKVADDGELLVRGPQVFRGYRGNVTATRESLDSAGWLHTGDLGDLDSEGFVRITGRKKEVIVTAGGKNVAPTVLEEQIRSHPLVDQCLVVGDGRPYLAALVTLDSGALARWADSNGRPVPAQPHRDPAVRAAVQSTVDAANRYVSQAESVRSFAILDADWTEESGHLTPSLKLRRTTVLRDFHDDVERLYP